MANDLAAQAPRILAMSLGTLSYELSFLTTTINTDFGADARKKGTSVDVPIPYPMGDADDIVPSHLPHQSADIAPETISIPLNKWKGKAFHLTDEEREQVDEGIIPMQLTEAAKSIAYSVTKDFWELYKKVANTVGTPGQTPFQNVDPPTQIYHGLLTAKEVRRLLNKAGVPMDNRALLLDVDAEANASTLAAFSRADQSGTDITIREGMIGRKLGFDWYFNQLAPTHTNATTTGSSLTVNGNQTAGAKVLAVSGCTGVHVGDVFTIAGDDTQYAIQAGSTTASWNITPALAANAASTSVITLVAASAAVINLAYHRDAFVMVNRPLLDANPMGNIIESFMDNRSGLTMRLEISRQRKQTLYELDFLYGMQCLRPESAVRIYG